MFKKFSKFKTVFNIFLAICLLLSVVVISPVSPAKAAVPTNARGGFSPGSLILGLDATVLATYLNDMASTNAQYVRVDLDWSQIQGGGSTSWNWVDVDRVINGCVSRGLKVIALVTYCPSWANGNQGFDYPPTAAHAADWQNFVKTCGDRYISLGVVDWEMWNEPNAAGFWKPVANVADYTNIVLKPGYNGIKQSASAQGKTVNVITGGTTPASVGDGIPPVDFLTGIYNNGGQAYFDSFGTHPYSFPHSPNDPDEQWNWLNNVPIFNTIMVSHGDGAKKIWATEYGYPTVPCTESFSISEELQAQYVTEAYARWNAWSYTGPMIWYQYRDGTDVGNWSLNCGLVRSNGTYKPAMLAFKTVMAAAPTPTPTVPPVGGSVPTSGLQMLLNFNETSGTTAADTSGGGRNATLTNGPVWSTDGKYSGSVSLDGTNDTVNTVDMSYSGDFTIGAWVKLSGTIDAADAIVGQDAAGQDLNFYGGKLRLFSGSGDIIVANTSTTADVWTHYALTRSGTSLKLYVNGVQDATATSSIVFTPKSIGRGSGGYMLGKMDDFALYNRALSSTEVTQLKNRTANGATPTPTPTPTPPPPAGGFIKGINCNGNAEVIEGNTWLSHSAAVSAGFTVVNGTLWGPGSTTYSPAVDTATGRMLNSLVYRSGANVNLTQTIANGTYNVYLWSTENYQANARSFNLNLEGSQKASNLGLMALNTWQKYGPYNVTVSDGVLNIDLVRLTGDPQVSGIAIYNNGGPTPTPTPTPTPAPNPNLAIGKTATASSVEFAGVEAAKAIDGDTVSRWSSAYSDPQWISVDLGTATTVGKVILNWNVASGKSFKIQTSTNGSTWTDRYTTTTGAGGIQTITFTAVSARYVRMYGTLRNGTWGYSIHEFEIYNH